MQETAQIFVEILLNITFDFLPCHDTDKLGLIGGETQPQYPQYPQYMPPPPPQQQAQAPAGGTSSLVDGGSAGNKEQHGAV